MAQLSLAPIQMRCEKAAIDENMARMRQYVAEAKKENVDIICFPEMNITGYIDPQQHPRAVISRDHSAIRQTADLSREYHTTIIAGFVEENTADKPFITQFAAQDGEVLGYYRKKTIKDEEAKWFSPGEDLPVFSYSGINYGLSISPLPPRPAGQWTRIFPEEAICSPLVVGVWFSRPTGKRE